MLSTVLYGLCLYFPPQCYMPIVSNVTEQVSRRSSLLSGRNVSWPRHMVLPPIESRWVCRRDRRTDGRQAVTLCFPSDAASIIISKSTCLDLCLNPVVIRFLVPNQQDSSSRESRIDMVKNYRARTELIIPSLLYQPGLYPLWVFLIYLCLPATSSVLWLNHHHHHRRRRNHQVSLIKQVDTCIKN